MKEKIGYRELAAQAEYRKLLLANLISRFGDSVDAVAFTWLVYRITGSASWSAIVFACNQLPTVFVQPFAGALVEGMNKKRVLVATNALRGCMIAALALFYFWGCVTPWMLILFTLVISTVEAFNIPAGIAVVPKILKEKYYTAGISLNKTAGTVAELAGAGAGGIILGCAGIGTAIFIDGVTFLAAAAILGLLKMEETGLKRGTPDGKEYIKTLREGVLYLKEQPVIRNLCLLAASLNVIIAPFNCLAGPLVSEVFGQESGLLSAISVSMTVGMGCGSACYPHISGKCGMRKSVVCSGLGMGAGLFLLSLGKKQIGGTAGAYALAVFAALLIGFASGVFATALSVQFTRSVRPEYLARAGAIFNAGAVAALPLASAMISGLALVLAVWQIFSLTALICVIIFAGIAVMKPALE